ncbi:MAG: hypothetical protein ABFS32_08130 [Bacteroidota bacterium]
MKKKYTTKSTTSKMEEPMVPHIPLLVKLQGMSFLDITDAHMSGHWVRDLEEQTNLGKEEMAGIMGISMSKYYDLLKSKDIGSDNIDALADFATFWQKGLDAFDEDVSLLKEWLESRNENLGNIKPIELLSSRVGRRILESAFLRIEYSTYG